MRRSFCNHPGSPWTEPPLPRSVIQIKVLGPALWQDPTIMKRGALLIVTCLAAAGWLGLEPSVAQTASEATGQQLYQTHCQLCHGPNGRGDGPAGRALDPPPVDLTQRPYRYGCEPEPILRTLREGIPHTAMPPFGGRLSERELRLLTNYVRSLQRPLGSPSL